MNKVGPYFNTHETYHYYSLPVCHPNPIISLPLKLGQVLRGDRMASAPLPNPHFVGQNSPVLLDIACAPSSVADDAQQHRLGAVRLTLDSMLMMMMMRARL